MVEISVLDSQANSNNFMATRDFHRDRDNRHRVRHSTIRVDLSTKHKRRCFQLERNSRLRDKDNSHSFRHFTTRMGFSTKGKLQCFQLERNSRLSTLIAWELQVTSSQAEPTATSS